MIVRSLCTAGAVLLLAACATPPAPPPAEAAATIRFAAEIGGAPFACGRSYRLGTPPVMATPTDLRLYVTDVALLRADGAAVALTLEDDGRWQGQGVALLDFEDASGPCAAGGSAGTNMVLRGRAPASAYTGLRFTMAVPVGLNHQDATLAAAPLNVTAMFWNWQNGYKFLKLDLAVPGVHGQGGAHMAGAGHSPGQGYALHVGSTQCAASAPTQPGVDCRNPNRAVVTLTGFDPLRDTVVIDPAAVLAQADLRRNTAGTAPGCMAFPGDPDCNTVLPKLGLGYGGVPAGPQRLFSTRPGGAIAAR